MFGLSGPRGRSKRIIAPCLFFFFLHSPFFSLSLSVFLDMLMLFVSDTLACDPCTAGMVRETSQGFYLDGLFVTFVELREYIVDDPLSCT